MGRFQARLGTYIHKTGFVDSICSVSRPNYEIEHLELPPGRYRVLGFVPMTGLLLDKWIEVSSTNAPGCYGAADIPIATAIPNLARIEDASGATVWSHRESD